VVDAAYLADLVIAGSHASFLQVQKIMRLLRLARVVKLMRNMKVHAAITNDDMCCGILHTLRRLMLSAS